MLKLKAYILFVFLPFIVSACNQENASQSTKHVHTHTLIPSKNLNFPIDSLTNITSVYMDYYMNEKGDCYLVWLNTPNSHIHFYNLKTKKRDWVIPFQGGNNGTDAIGSLGAFAIKNKDSIVVLSKKKNKLYVADFNGKILHKAELKAGTIQLLMSIHNYKRMALLPPNKIIYHKSPFIKAELGGYWNFAMTFCYDLKTQKYDSVYKYDGKTSKDVYSAGHSYTGFYPTKKGSYLYSMGTDKEIVVTDLKGKVEYKYAASKYNTKSIPKITKGHTDKEGDEFYANNYAYRHIIYDEYRDVYYRFALHPNENMNEDYDHGKPFSIIILDKEFKIIGETEVIKSFYYYDNFFVAHEGLYISNNHKNNPNLKEDILSFQLFKLKRNE